MGARMPRSRPFSVSGTLNFERSYQVRNHGLKRLVRHDAALVSGEHIGAPVLARTASPLADELGKFRFYAFAFSGSEAA